MTDEENAEDPMLIIDEWQALLDFLRLTEESNEEHLELTTYGLKVVSIGTRTTTSSLTIDSVRETIRHTWEDFIDPGCTIYLHFIRPQAVDHAHRLQVLVEINPGDVEIPPNLVPTLRQTHWHSSGLMTTMATYLEDMITSIDILRDPALRESGCLGAVQCNVHIEGEIALPLRYYLLRPGSLVAAFVHDEQSRHPDGPADDQDDLVMMQQSALPRPSSSPTLKTVRLVGTHSTSAMIQMDTTEQFSTELETRWPFHRRSHDDIEAVHEVTDPPTFSGQAPDPMYIINFRDDRFSQTHTDDVMGLVTIIFDETTEGLRRERLRVQWLPHKASRDNLLDFLRATWFCRRQDVICTLYHDGWLWPVHDQTLRTLDYGDHVRLQLRSSGPGFCDMQFSEGVSRQRKIYESSSEVEEREEEPEQEESERGGAASSQRTARSRSRGRPHADGENTDSNSFLQLTAKKVQGTRPALQEITNTLGRAHALCLDEALEPMELGKPHVLDLWCAEPTTPVAGPQQVCRAPLVLDDLLRTAVRLFPLPDLIHLPAAVELWDPTDEIELLNELQQWGLENIKVWPLTDTFQTVGFLCGPPPDQPTTIYWDIEDSLLHPYRSLDNVTEVDHMRYLAKLGYGRAAVIGTCHPTPMLQIVNFKNGKPQSTPGTECTGPEPTAIPSAQPRTAPPRRLTDKIHIAASVVDNLHVRAEHVNDVRELFGTGDGVLQADLTELELHPATQEALQDLPEGDVHRPYDRLLIYVDGSSMGYLKHKDARHVEETSTPDAWSFVVLGEYADGRPHPLEYIGWTANQVIYEQGVDHYAGATHIGSDTAERESLIWAGVWRLSIDLDTPTLFVSDSQTAGGFALGTSGTQELTTGHYLVRGVHQALMEALGRPDYGIVHTKSHRGDPWNELADVAAKQACKHYRFRQRQRITLQHWTPILPHLWFFYSGTEGGLPQRTANGVIATAPAIPTQQTKEEQLIRMKGSSRTLRVSAATANVRTLYVGPDGFGGKLQYLQEQFTLDHFNIVAIQEARTPAGMTGKGRDYLRIASGCQDGHLGVETWISLTQPFGTHRGRPFFVKPSQIVILHGDPRRLLLVIHFGPFTLGVLNVHGPHTGRPEAERQLWWKETTDLLHTANQIDELLVLGDFNAKSGQCDHRAVFEFDDLDNSNTDFMLEFLHEFSLCLPATTAVHQGAHDTWTSPDGQHTQRIDYIAVNTERLGACTVSTVLRHIDLGHEGDHYAVGLDMQWDRKGRLHTVTPTSQRQQYDRELIKCNQNILNDLANSTPVGWTEDIETQVQALNTTISDTLSKHCPKPHAQAKKPFMTEEIMKMRQHKNAIKRRQSEAWRLYRRTLLLRVVQAWRNMSDTPPEFPDGHDVQLQVGLLRLGAEALSTTRYIRRQIRNAKGAHVEKIVNEIPAAASGSQILAQLRPVIGTSNSRKRKGSAMPYVLDGQGAPCQTPEAIVDRWVEYFGQMEGGDRLSLQEQRDHWLRGLRQLRAEDLSELQLHDLPKLTDLEAAMRRVTPGKAVGDDAVPPELCRYHAAALAKLVYPGLLKLFFHGQEDLTHKGGRLITAYKRGPRNHCNSYRSLLISSHIGKCMHRALRCGQSQLYVSYMQRQQIGGRPKISVSIGLHMARAHHRAHKLQNKPSALLFLDLTEAYYRVLRPLALGSDLTDHDIASMIKRLNLPTEVMRDLHQHLQEADALQLASVPNSHRRYLQALHRDTYFKIDGQTDQCRTTIGSRPGDTFADVVFGYLWSRVLKHLEATLESAQLLEHIPVYDGIGPRAQCTDQTTTFLGPTWCDDLCICISAPTSVELEHRAGVISGTLLDTCLSFGMLPNLTGGKTELMMCFRGKDSRRLRVKYYSQEQGGKMTIVGEYGQHQVNVVGEYKHLGGMLHHGGRLTKEIRKRLATAHNTFSHQRRLLFQNKKFDLPKRVELFRSLVLSGLLYGTESWVPGSRCEDLHLHSAIIRLYKRLLRTPPDSHITDGAVCSELGLATPTILMRTSRLRYLGQLYRSLPQDLWNVILQDQEWIAVAEGDLAWMWGQLHNSSDLTDPSTGWEKWEYILTHHPGYWKRLVRRAMEHDILQQKNHELVQDCYARTLTYLRSFGRFAEDTQQEAEYEPTAFGCLTCGTWFRSKAGEGAHMFRVHARTSKLRTLYNGTSCTVCLREYHTPFKLQAHLRYKRSCREALIARGALYDPIPGKGSVQHSEQERAHNGLLPVQIAQGPCRHEPRREDWEHEDGELYLRLGETVLDWQETTERSRTTLERMLRAAPVEHPTSWTTWSNTLRSLETELRDLARRDLHDCEEVVFTLLQALSQTVSWPGLPVRKGSNQDGPKDGETACASLLESKGRPCWQRTASIPREWTRHRVVLHAFSGRRRVGDFQFYLDHFAKSLDGMVIHVLSLDVIISREHGNLMSVEVRNYWIGAAKNGWVVAFLAGPPCETWSRARFQALDPESNFDKKGPRPLRSAKELWGLPSLQLREMTQILFGNTLLTFAIELAATMAMTGGIGVLEHPAEPAEPHLPSIFKLAIMRLLRQLPGVEVVRVLQGYLGSESPKPTDLLTINLPGLESALKEHHTRQYLPLARSIGKDDCGQYLTGRLKEYPPAMCRALAQKFCEELRSCHVQCSADMPATFLDICHALENTDYGDSFGPDYAGG